MNKLSNKSIEKFKIFLEDEEFSYISLTRHELKILYSIYNSVISIINESEKKENKLIKYLEEEYKLNNEEWKDAKSRNNEIYYFGKLKAISSILEKVKSGKYE